MYLKVNKYNKNVLRLKINHGQGSQEACFPPGKFTQKTDEERLCFIAKLLFNIAFNITLWKGSS